MRWRDRRVSTNVEDRRGGGGVRAGGISIIGLVVAFVAWKFLALTPTSISGNAAGYCFATIKCNCTRKFNSRAKEASDFVGTVLADTEDTWTPIFKQLGKTYTPPKLVLFSGMIQSGCGTAQSAMGPFYCPADQKVYIDTEFFKDMREQMGISGEQNQTELSRQDQAGDFAQACGCPRSRTSCSNFAWYFISSATGSCTSQSKKVISYLYVQNYKLTV